MGTSLEDLVRVEAMHQLEQLRHQAGPASLVAGPQPGAIVAMEIFIEQDMIAPVRVGLKCDGPAVDGPPPLVVSEEDPREPPANVHAHLEEVHQTARPRWTFDGKGVAIVEIELEQSP